MNNDLENLNLQLDLIYDLILDNLGNITDCKTRQILIDLLRYQEKTTQLLIKIMKKNLEEVTHD